MANYDILNHFDTFWIFRCFHFSTLGGGRVRIFSLKVCTSRVYFVKPWLVPGTLMNVESESNQLKIICK